LAWASKAFGARSKRPPSKNPAKWPIGLPHHGQAGSKPLGRFAVRMTYYVKGFMKKYFAMLSPYGL
jgi:hypothetical protein